MSASISSSNKNWLREKAEAAATRVQEKRIERERKAQADAQAETVAKITQWQEIIHDADESNIINISNMKPEKRTALLRLCTKGIPPSMRGTVWPMLIGAETQISPSEFAKLGEAADALRVSSGLGSAFLSKAALFGRPSSFGTSSDNDTATKQLVHDSGDAVDNAVKHSGSGTGDPIGDMSDDFASDLRQGIEEMLREASISSQMLGSQDNSRVLCDTSDDEEGKPGPQDQRNIADEDSPGGSLTLRDAKVIESQLEAEAGLDSGPAASAEPGSSTPIAGSPPRLNDSTPILDDSGKPIVLNIDLSEAFSLDAPTPPRRKSRAGRSKGGIEASHLNGLNAFEDIVEQRSDLSQGINEDGAKQSPGRATAALIKWDLPRTFPTLKFFHDGGSIQADLERILCAYTIYKPDVGYVQGMSFVAAMLLLYLDDSQAFSCLCNLLAREGTRDFFSLQKRNVTRYVHCFDHFFRQSLPLLFEHMRRQELSSEMFLLDWHLTLFAKALPLDVAARVWDCYLAGGELFSLKCALGILRLYAPRLCQLNMEEAMAFLTHLPQDLKADQLLDSVAHIKISIGKYNRFVEAYKAREKGGADPGSQSGKNNSVADNCSLM